MCMSAKMAGKITGQKTAFVPLISRRNTISLHSVIIGSRSTEIGLLEEKGNEAEPPTQLFQLGDVTSPGLLHHEIPDISSGT